MAETVRCWLVERSYGDRDLVTVVYATPDGRRAVTKELPMTSIAHGSVAATAAKEIDADALEPVEPADRDRYREEIERMRSDHDPDDEI